MKLTNLTAVAFIGVLSLSACTEKYVVDGTWKEGAGKTVYLQKKVEKEAQVIDSTVVAADGSFSFSLANKVDLYEVNAANEAKKVILVSDVPVSVTIAMETRTAKDSTVQEVLAIKAEGDEQIAYENGYDLIMASAFMSLGKMFTFSNILSGEDKSMSIDSAVAVYTMIEEKMQESMANYVDSAKNNYGVAYFIKEYMIQNKSFDEVEAAYAKLTDRVKQSNPGIELKTAIDELASVSVGGTAPDIKLMTPDSTELSLYSLRGHYVLLDFWASWCGPCLREVPNVKAIYEKYHDKGFEIFGVSLDETVGPWKAAIKRNNMNWHHVSSLKGWECPAAKRYNVTGIPRMYIIDPDGKIIAQDLRGEELAKFVAGLYEK